MGEPVAAAATAEGVTVATLADSARMRLSMWAGRRQRLPLRTLYLERVAVAAAQERRSLSRQHTQQTPSTGGYTCVRSACFGGAFVPRSAHRGCASVLCSVM